MPRAQSFERASGWLRRLVEPLAAAARIDLAQQQEQRALARVERGAGGGARIPAAAGPQGGDPGAVQALRRIGRGGRAGDCALAGLVGALR